MLMMEKMQSMLVNSGGGGPSYLANAVDFDGSGDYLRLFGGLSGASDSPFGIFSAWVRFDADDGFAKQIITEDAVSFFTVTRNSAYRIDFTMRNAAGTSRFSFRSNLTYPASGTWRHILASWNTNFTAGLKERHLYINDVSDTGLIVDVDPNFNIDYTRADWGVCAVPGTGADNLSACISEVYFAPGDYMDFSVVANRRKFIGADGKPVSLGPTGALPTGASPKVYLKGDYTGFSANSGTGGNFNVVGSVTAASTSPSD